ncbi:MAG: Gfo/Idh/MocA family oxidoreductase [Bacteroidales bacterium]|nr:Gfo/Idh/MocA family oxidoreductase [Bacteroidales bacterium]
MIKAAVIGLGKMGISHAAILGGLPDVELAAVCDTDGLIQSGFGKLTRIPFFTDYRKMIDTVQPDCVYVITPTRMHYEMVKYALQRGCHVFCEKPFALTVDQGEQMVALARERGVVNQVGYHNRYIGTFNEMKRLLAEGVIGHPFHFLGEAYGPVVLKKQGSTWRSDKKSGGGCIEDYAAHVLNLIDYVTGSPLVGCAGVQMPSIFSKEVDDATYGSLVLENGLRGQISVNWSDDTVRKMTTSVKIQGDGGKLEADATTLKVYVKEDHPAFGLEKGWNFRYITDVTDPVAFNLRGEEYTAETEDFIDAIRSGRTQGRNSFESALNTDRIIAAMIADWETSLKKEGK